MGSSLTWELVNGSVDVGERTVDSDDLNQPKGILSLNPSISGSFEIIVTNYTSEAITSTMSFVTLSEYEGYGIRCRGAFILSTVAIISIPGTEE